uniref:Uncharacterized protein n=1 Tax=uncultured marine virus TaxID=186617 RepID=A0A0F7L6F1_9VIRU|nr:hypothetical protein [uncultured marine virus]
MGPSHTSRCPLRSATTGHRPRRRRRDNRRVRTSTAGPSWATEPRTSGRSSRTAACPGSPQHQGTAPPASRCCLRRQGWP